MTRIEVPVVTGRKASENVVEFGGDVFKATLRLDENDSPIAVVEIDDENANMAATGRLNYFIAPLYDHSADGNVDSETIRDNPFADPELFLDTDAIDKGSESKSSVRQVCGNDREDGSHTVYGVQCWYTPTSEHNTEHKFFA